MAIPYTQRVNRWIERLFNARGGSPTVDGVETQVQVDIPFASGVEDRYLQGWNRFAVSATQAAVAAQNSRVRIRNPVGSNAIIVLEQLSAFTTTSTDAANVSYGATTTDLATLITLTFTRMDPRGNPQPVAIVSTNAQAAGGQALLQRAYLASVTTDFIVSADQQIPILPGQALDIQAVNVNSQLVVTFIWRERALEPSELV